MTLKLTALANALKTLDIALEEFSRNLGLLSCRDGCIQRFEYCLELATRFIHRALEQKYTKAQIEAMAFRDLMRLAAESGMIADQSAWIIFKQKRNKTSHMYHPEVAEEVCAVIADFRREAFHLLSALEKWGGND